MTVKVIYAQNSFKGKVKFKVQDANQKSMNIIYYFRNGKMSSDLPISVMGGKTYMIFKNKSMYVVIPSHKMYMEYSGSFDKLMNCKPTIKYNSGAGKGNKQKTNWKEIWKKAKTESGFIHFTQRL